MNKILESFQRSTMTFIHDEEGAQVVEYALIIALVSIGLAVALQALSSGTSNPIQALITRITNCLNGNNCQAP